MSSIPATPKRDRWAHLRFAIVGPLLAAPPEPGQLYNALCELAGKTGRHPLIGTDVRFAAVTIERWFYTARHASDPVNRLSDRRRGDRGTFHSLAPAVIAALRAQYDAHPGWSVQLHFDNLKVALRGSVAVLPDGAPPPLGQRHVAPGPPGAHQCLCPGRARPARTA